MKTVIANALRFMGAVRKPAPAAVAGLDDDERAAADADGAAESSR